MPPAWEGETPVEPQCSRFQDWMQTSKKVSNPYGGKEMITCGEIKH